MLRRLGLGKITRTMSSTAQRNSPTSAPPIQGSNFKIALVQLGGTNSDKAHNIALARDKIRQAAQGDENGKPQMIVLPVSL